MALGAALALAARALVLSARANGTAYNLDLIGATAGFGSISGLTMSRPGDHLGRRLEAQTNPIGVGLANWVTVAGSTTTKTVQLPIDATQGSVFYRLTYR